ncbi:VOC family protein [Actinokineospora guangxiensis]|uniref:VOC family protein n=1 Tax=Actinokineospora guangxiensis TaxID=1490288 RepID=A0ABW0ENQ5_9PSEU
MLRPARGVPCLLVDDVERAVAHYRDVLGFATADRFGEPPTSALLSGRHGQVLLQLAPGGVAEFSHRRLGGLHWDALFFVDDIEAVAESMRARGARIQVGLGITAVSDKTLEVRDEWGNVLAFAGAPVGLGARVRSAASKAVPSRLTREVKHRLRRREEVPELRRIRAFIDGLDPDRPPFFMFFTQGLLHWVRNAERLVPDDVNLVFIGSALPAEEQAWLRDNTSRPLHNIELGVDDNTTWDFLFDCNRRGFGYLDIDCFVLNPDLFRDMATLAPDVAMNGIWTYETDSGEPIACTHFAFINADAVADLRAKDSYLSPANYDWEGATISLLHPRDYCRVPSARQREVLLKVLPPGDDGKPLPPGEAPFFDTLVAFQVGAYAGGYRTERVRPLAHRTQHTINPEAPVWQQDLSDEVVHVGGVSYYQRWFHSPRLRGMYLAAEHAMMAPIVDLLPSSYGGRVRALETELAHLGLDPARSASLVRAHLVEDRGLAQETADRVLAVGSGRGTTA